MTAPAGQLARLRRRGFWLEYASMGWMTAEAAVAITAGVLASSVALVGFGLDSVIEFFAAAIVLWQLRGQEAERETRAVRLIGVTFFALAAYLAVAGVRDLTGHARPGESLPGLAVAAAALLVMPALAAAKLRTGRALGNRTLIADSAETARRAPRPGQRTTTEPAGVRARSRQAAGPESDLEHGPSWPRVNFPSGGEVKHQDWPGCRVA